MPPRPPFKVRPTKRAAGQLADLWANAADSQERDDIAIAYSEIEQRLRFDPDQQGMAYATPKHPTNRVLVVHPLRAHFVCDPSANTVRIWKLEKNLRILAGP